MGLVLSVSLLLLEASPSSITIAVTRDGLRVESIAPQVGDLSLRTPWGSLSTPLDPIVEVVDGSVQLSHFETMYAAGLLDDEDLLRDLSTAGQLSALGARLEALVASDKQTMLPYELVESWAEKIDPVPRETKRDQRVAWLWKAARDSRFVAGEIAGWRLRDEIRGGSMVVNRDRNITESDLVSEGFSARHPWTRRAAARVSGKQHSPLMREYLLFHSLDDDSPAVRAACAVECELTMPHASR